MIEIRKATAADIPSIFALVENLAEYEKAADEVTTTIASYEKDFEEKIFEAIVAVSDGQVIGMALYYMSFSTWKGRMLYLEDFVVLENYRRFGVGQLLFDAFLAEAKNQKAQLAKWQVLDWNEPAIRFYEKNHATIEKNWWNVKIFF